MINVASSPSGSLKFAMNFRWYHNTSDENGYWLVEFLLYLYSSVVSAMIRPEMSLKIQFVACLQLGMLVTLRSILSRVYVP